RPPSTGTGRGVAEVLARLADISQCGPPCEREHRPERDWGARQLFCRLSHGRPPICRGGGELLSAAYTSMSCTTRNSVAPPMAWLMLITTRVGWLLCIYPWADVAVGIDAASKGEGNSPTACDL